MDINYTIIIIMAIIANAPTDNLKVIVKILREVRRMIG